MIGVTIWSFFLMRTSGGRLGRPLAFAIACTIGVAGALVFGWIVQDPSRWPLPFGSPQISEIAQTYAQGQIVWDRPETYHQPPVHLWSYWAITADRMLHFFVPVAAGFSSAHIALQLLFYIPVYVLGGYFLIMLVRGRTRLPQPQQDVFYAALAAIAIYAIFHAMVQVDYDWRYRIPIIPHLILLASGGLAILSERYDIRGVLNMNPAR